MKNFFRFVGVITLLFGTFIYTEEVATTSKTTDELLNKIESVKDSYRVKPVEPIIEDNTIIPGKNGREVDVLESYNKLSQALDFNDKLFVYKTVYVKQKLKNNKDKFVVGGNRNEKNVGFVFKVSNDDSIKKIVSVLDENNVKATFYITSTYLENNYRLITSLIHDGHTIGNLSNNEDYNDGNFSWMSTILTNSGKQKNNYCYCAKKNIDILKICSLHDSYTIVPNVVIEKNPFINVKKDIFNGAIISFDVNRQLNNEIYNIVNYVMSKGYKIVSLEELLKE